MTWLLKSLGVSGEILQHLDQAVLAFQYPVFLYAGLAILAPVGVFIYRRQQRNFGGVPSWVTIALTLTRIIILLLLILALSAPYLKLDYQLERKPILAVLFDQSESMQLPAGPFASEQELVRVAQAAGYPAPEGKLDAETRKALNRISRAKLAQTIMEMTAGALGESLVEKSEVRFYTFSRDLQSVPANLTALKLPEPPQPGGAVTYLGEAVGKVLDEAGGTEVAGVVVFTDGQNNGGVAPSEVAHRAASLGAPIFAVPTGTSTVIQDVSIVDVFTSGQVALGDAARVSATVYSQGLDGKTVNVQLLDGTTVLDTKELVLRSTEQQQMDLVFEATRAGARYLTVNIPPLPEEPEYLQGNNTDTAFLRVGREKLRVLHIEGLPRWDFRFLKNAMRRDHGLGGRATSEPDIVLEAEWRRRPPEQAAVALPATAEDLAQYHTVILGDASPRLVTPEFIKILGEAVREKGLGLIVQAGPLAMPHAYDERLKDLLPVRPHPRAAGLEAPGYRPFRVELTPDGAIQEAMRLYEDTERNRNVWARMPPYHWCAAADHPSPGATVLAWNPDVTGKYGRLPLIAYHYAGDGKVMFVGTDSTWLWRQNVADRFFYKFWGQSIRFVARRDESNKDINSLEVRPLRMQPGESVQIELRAYRADSSPRKERDLSVSIMGGKSARQLQLVANEELPGQYTGSFTPDTTGEYRVAFDPGDTTVPVDARFRVMTAGEELRHPNLNRATLELLAHTSGGKVVDLADLSTIPPLLTGEKKLMPVHREATIWDNWLMLVVLVFVYSVDVGLRRLRGLA